MDTVRVIFLYLSVGFSFFFVQGQQIGNYVSNGSFENMLNYNSPLLDYKAIGWSGVDSLKPCAPIYSLIYGNAPNTPVGYQMPRHGNNFIRTTWFYDGPNNGFTRSNLKNRLRGKLTAGKAYCVKMYVCRQEDCPASSDGFGFYFGDSLVDTIKYNCRLPLTFLTPQVSNPNGNIISDATNWTLISGTFTAIGSEKYLIVSNFKSTASTNTIANGSPPTGMNWAEYFVDEISCFENNLNAHAGKDTAITLGDSLYIGRLPDYILDTSCVWFKSPNLSTPFDTASGFWVKPIITTTYVVRQELDCSPLKWDTVVVTINTNYVGLDRLQSISDKINLFPNPTSRNLSVSNFSGADISTFSISNCLGQIIQNGNIIPKNNLINVETSELKSGLYQIHLKTPYGIVTKKFIKTN